MIPFLRAQNELLTDMRRRMRDPDGARWTNYEIYTGINDCLLSWYGRVSIPHLYTLPGGWASGQNEYALPSYIRGPIDPQQKRYSSRWLHGSGVSSDADTWVNIQGYSVEPNGTGGQTLRLDFSPNADDARIIWWQPNGQLPLSPPVLSATIDSDDTSLVLSTPVTDISDAGYIKINAEWLHYAGVTYGASTTTLNNLLRGLNETAAASHTNGAAVQWGVGVHRQDLYGQLYAHVQSFLHGLYLTDAAESERVHHERLSLYHRQLADAYWRTYTPARTPRIRLGHGSVGPLQEDAAYHQYTRTWGVQL